MRSREPEIGISWAIAQPTRAANTKQMMNFEAILVCLFVLEVLGEFEAKLKSWRLQVMPGNEQCWPYILSGGSRG